jgi:hypothetical protein
MLATKKPPQLPKAEESGDGEEDDDRDHGYRHRADDHPVHGASVPVRKR